MSQDEIREALKEELNQQHKIDRLLPIQNVEGVVRPQTPLVRPYQYSPDATLEWREGIHNGSILPNGDHDLVLRVPKPSTPITLEEGIKLYRFGTKENGLLVEVYPDGAWSHTLIKDGKFVRSSGESV